MKLAACARLLGLAGLLLLLPAFSAAQGSVKCESNDGHRNYCGDYGRNDVSLDRQISGSPCVEGQSWGVDRRGLWVDRGCRAYFTVSSRRGGGRFDNNDQNGIKCESNDGRRNYCGRYDFDQVRLDRQISGSPCIQGQTWGVDREGLWVDRGCRAYFSVRADRGRHGGYDHDHDRADDHDRDDDHGWWQRDPGDTWPPRGNWHGGRWERGGACFYQDRDFGGAFFCLRRGEQREALAGYGDDISSIRAFGGARVTVFDDRNFSGARETLNRDVSDLRQVGVRQKPGHTWNNRISSVAVQ